MTTTLTKSHRTNDLSPADKVINDVIKMNLKHLARISSDPEVKAAANSLLQKTKRSSGIGIT